MSLHHSDIISSIIRRAEALNVTSSLRHHFINHTQGRGLGHHSINHMSGIGLEHHSINRVQGIGLEKKEALDALPKRGHYQFRPKHWACFNGTIRETSNGYP